MKLFKDLKVMVIGDIMMDRYICGDVNRVSPEAPVPVVNETDNYFTLGGAGNVYKNLRVFGCDVKLCGVIGRDNSGDSIVDSVDYTDGLIRYARIPTTVKTRVVSGNHHIVRIDREVNCAFVDPYNQIIEFARKTINDMDIVIISDYNKGVISHKLMKGLSAITTKFIPIIVDPKNTLDHYWDVSVIMPNKKEAEVFTGICPKNNTDLQNMAWRMKNETKCKTVLITLGKDGMFLSENETTKNTYIPSCAREVYEVSGAGDTAVAVFSIAYATREFTNIECAEMANIAAGMVVGKVGTSVVDTEEFGGELYEKGYIKAA